MSFLAGSACPPVGEAVEPEATPVLPPPSNDEKTIEEDKGSDTEAIEEGSSLPHFLVIFVQHYR